MSDTDSEPGNRYPRVFDSGFFRNEAGEFDVDAAKAFISRGGAVRLYPGQSLTPADAKKLDEAKIGIVRSLEGQP